MYRRTYWSSTRFADWIRGTPKPISETSEGWDRWEELARHKHIIRYWISDTLLDIIQNIVLFPIDQLYSLKYYVVNRWVDQSHALVASKKHIPRGQWRDLDTRMLYCLFDELVDFVEIEKAHKYLVSDKEQSKKLKWYQTGSWRTRTWRNPKAGLAYLEWETTLTDEEWISAGEEPKITSQALAAKEIIELYNWWMDIRPLRPDPYDESGWSAYCDSKRERGIGFLHDDNSGIDTKNMLDIINLMEKQYDSEDTEMMIRLVKVRGSLWT